MTHVPLITIVLATYNRPASLRLAIRSVLRQTLADWRLLVIGDACDARTAEVVAAIGDSRIDFVNLPARCGEQSIPNSIGMALAASRWIALLNHDDVLLADHLEQAMASLDAGGGEFFAGRSAFARFSGQLNDGRLVPVFSEMTPSGRSLGDVFSRGCEMFEPCSAWVFSRDLARRVGPWRAAATIYRTPMEDWLLRAWRTGERLVESGDITVLHILTHNQKIGPHGSYAWDRGEDQMLDGLIHDVGAGEIRSALLRQIGSDLAVRLPRLGFSRLLLSVMGDLTKAQERRAEELLSASAAREYLKDGRDSFEQFCIESGLEKGRAMRIALRLRTGEELPPPPDFAGLLQFARQSLQSP